MNNQEIITRFQMVRSNRQVIQDTWDDIELFIAPYRGRFFKDERNENSIQWRKRWVYDGTAIMAAQTLASSLNSRLTSASMQWFGLRFRQEELKDDNEALAWLEDCAKRCFDALLDSNFNVEINETYEDLVCFGTSVIIEEENKDETESALNFQSVPIKECYFEEDSTGHVLNFYRHLQWSPKQIKDHFGEEAIPQWIADIIEDEGHDPDMKIDIIFCIYRRQDIKIVENIKSLTPENRPYGWKYTILKDSEAIGDEGGYYEMPASVPRWRTTSSSMWGNSPAMVALGDTLSLNEAVKLNLTAVEKALDPPIITTSRGLIGDMDLTAGGLTTVRDINEISPFQSGARFDVTYQEMDRLRENINNYFFIPQLVLPPMQGTPATATEISVRMQQLESLIGPTLGRLQTDMLKPIVTRTFQILFRAGKLPDMPPIVQALEGQVDIEYTSPFAKTQQASNAQAIERWLGTIAGYAEMNPDLLDIPDWDEAFKQLAYMNGVSPKLIQDQAQIDAARAQRQQIQQQQQEGEAMQAQGEGLQAIQGAQGEAA